MKTKKYKILLLSDLKNSSDTILKTTANLAKIIGGEIDLLHVKKPTDVVKNDNQLSSLRSINRDYIISKKHIESIVKSVDTNLNITLGLTYGNVKQEIEAHIKSTNPDIVVLGKKRFKTINLSGDKLTKFILKKHKGITLIASNKHVLNYDKNLSLGVLNNLNEPFEALAKKLVSSTQKPVKTFNIKKPSTGGVTINDQLTSQKTVDYVFESNTNTIKNLSNYIAKSNVNLLCIKRNKVKSKKPGALNLNSLIKKVDVSLLLAG